MGGNGSDDEGLAGGNLVMLPGLNDFPLLGTGKLKTAAHWKTRGDFERGKLKTLALRGEKTVTECGI